MQKELAQSDASELRKIAKTDYLDTISKTLSF